MRFIDYLTYLIAIFHLFWHKYNINNKYSNCNHAIDTRNSISWEILSYGYFKNVTFHSRFGFIFINLYYLLVEGHGWPLYHHENYEKEN